MTREEAKEELMAIRPDRPKLKENRRKQIAIDVAIATMDAYEDLLRLITKEGYET